VLILIAQTVDVNTHNGDVVKMVSPPLKMLKEPIVDADIQLMDVVEMT